ncbi:MAG: hypothetical protein NTZ48_03230 [Candidatus Omnitrophica bacterium]|nr:hypothetical protein [Candidatus Omnitrophota bacterium]
MKILHMFSIMLEVAVFVLGIMLATVKKRVYGWGFALTFAIYVFYDLVNFLNLNVSQTITYLLFFISTLSALWALWWVYKEK